MRAFVVSAPGDGAVQQLDAPVAGTGKVLVEVARAGVCGTDVELFTGEMAYVRQGHSTYPLRLGHEGCGTVSALGEQVDPRWLGARVTGDTMLGCGHCRRCVGGTHWLCEDRSEIGIRGRYPGALAEQLVLPGTALRQLPDGLDDVAGAMVEPGGNAVRAVTAARTSASDRLLVIGLGTIGLLAAMLAKSMGAQVHLTDRSPQMLEFAGSLGIGPVWTRDELPALPWDVVIDASNGPSVPSLALDLVEPGGRVAFVGLAGSPSVLDARNLVLKDISAVGTLGASAGLAGAISAYASGAVDPRVLVGATIGLEQVGSVLAGARPHGAGLGPKIQVLPSAIGAQAAQAAQSAHEVISPPER